MKTTSKKMSKKLMAGVGVLSAVIMAGAISIKAAPSESKYNSSIGTITGTLSSLYVDDIYYDAEFDYSTSVSNPVINNGNTFKMTIAIKDALYGGDLDSATKTGSGNELTGSYNLYHCGYFDLNNGFAVYGAHEVWNGYDRDGVYTATVY